MNIYAWVFLWAYIFSYLEQIPRITTTGSCDKCAFTFIRKCQIDFYSNCTILHCHQSCTRLLIAPHPHQHLVLSVFLILATLIGVYWHFIMALNCIFFIINNIWASFHEFIGHLYIFTVRYLFTFLPICYWVVCLFIEL